MTILLSNNGTQYEKTVDCAPTLLSRDYKGYGKCGMVAVVEQVDGVMLGTSEQFNAGLCEEMSRSITTEGKNGVVEWKK